MSSISRGSFSGASLMRGAVYTARRGAAGAVLACRVPQPPGVKTGPPLPGELLADLLALVGEINGVLDPEELFHAIAQKLRRIVDYRILDIFLPDAEGFLAPAHVEGYDLDLASRFRVRVGEGIVGAAAAAREPVFVPDVSLDPRYISFFPGVVAELAIPLVSKDHLVGVLNIEGPAAAPFTPAARTALQVLAGHLAVAIENATLYRETRWYAGLLATLYEIGKETASILDLDELLRRLAEIVKRVIDYEMFGILLLNEERDELVLRKAVNFGPGKERSRIAVTEGLCGAAVRSREPVLVGDVRKDPRYVSLVAETRSELVVPLVHKDRVIGVLDLESPVLDRFTEQHVKVLTPLASQVAGAIENARLYAEIRQERGAPGAGAADRPRRPARALPGGLALGGGLGGLGPLPPRARARGRPLRLLRHGRGAPRRRHRRRGGQGGPGGALRGLRLGHDPRPGLRAAGAGRPDAAGEPLAAPAGHRGPLLHPRLRPLRLPGGLAAPRELRPAPPLPLPGGREAGGADRRLRPAPRDLRRGELRRGRRWSSRRATWSLSTPTAWSRRARAGRSTGRRGSRRGLETHAALAAPELGERLLADLEAFLGDESPADDVTLIVVKVL